MTGLKHVIVIVDEVLRYHHLEWIERIDMMGEPGVLTGVVEWIGDGGVRFALLTQVMRVQRMTLGRHRPVRLPEQWVTLDTGGFSRTYAISAPSADTEDISA